ncbi:MAG: alpha/beta hydrolase [Pseudomonadota bacterium]
MTNLTKTMLCLLAIGVFSGCTTAHNTSVRQTQTVPRFEPLADGDSFPVSVPVAFDSQRGYLVVEEERGVANGRTLRLPVAIVKPKAAEPNRSPVLFLSGGPGVGSLSAAAYPGAYPWTRDREFVVFGQRGTQHAEPALLCEAFGTALVDPDVPGGAVKAARDCARELEAAGIDRAAYHSANIAADIEDLRKVLGVERWSLYGMSYGTRVALTVARDYPGSVASMVLDSPLPHTVRYDDESGDNLLSVLRRVGEACAKQPSCARAFPDVASRYMEAVVRAQEKPWEVPAMAGRDAMTVSAADLLRAVPVFSREGLAAAPLIMDAIARRDLGLLVEAVTESGSSSNFAWGMRLSVWCSEALPFSKRATTADLRFDGLDSAVFAPETCAAWGVPARPVEEVAATISPIPTLIIAGEYDALTPPAWGFEAAETLSNSRVVVIPAGFHSETTNWGGDGCAMTAAASFFANPMTFLADKAEPACLAQAQGPEFVLDAEELLSD